MRRFVSSITFVGAAVLLLVHAAPAQAQATRTWVSGVGDDVNPCSRTAPCKTFAGAISKTATAGEINVLDPGGFGAVTITKAITIKSDHVEAGVLVSGTNGIIVNAPATANVILEGLDIEGLGTGLNGVQILAGSVSIVRCTIHGFTQNGVNSSGTSRTRIEDSRLTNNNGGFNMAANTSAIVENTVIDKNTTFAIQTAGPSTLVLTGSTLTGNPAALAQSGGAVIVSFGNNRILGTGTPTMTVPLS
jgi:Right handed beta helix region